MLPPRSRAHTECCHGSLTVIHARCAPAARHGVTCTQNQRLKIGQKRRHTREAGASQGSPVTPSHTQAQQPRLHQTNTHTTPRVKGASLDSMHSCPLTASQPPGNKKGALRTERRPWVCFPALAAPKAPHLKRASGAAVNQEGLICQGVMCWEQAPPAAAQHATPCSPARPTTRCTQCPWAESSLPKQSRPSTARQTQRGKGMKKAPINTYQQAVIMCQRAVNPVACQQPGKADTCAVIEVQDP